MIEGRKDMCYEAPIVTELIPESERIMADAVTNSAETDETVNISDLHGNLFG